jgi:hypothetical protein
MQLWLSDPSVINSPSVLTRFHPGDLTNLSLTYFHDSREPTALSIHSSAVSQFSHFRSFLIYPYVSNRSPPVCFLYDAGSNSGYDDNYLRSCVRYLGFYVSLWTGTPVVTTYDNFIISMYIPHWL